MLAVDKTKGCSNRQLPEHHGGAPEYHGDAGVSVMSVKSRSASAYLWRPSEVSSVLDTKVSSLGVCPGSLCLFLHGDITAQLLMMLSSEDNFQSLLQSRRMDIAHSRGAFSWHMSSAMSHLAGPTFNPCFTWSS